MSMYFSGQQSYCNTERLAGRPKVRKTIRIKQNHKSEVHSCIEATDRVQSCWVQRTCDVTVSALRLKEMPRKSKLVVYSQALCAIHNTHKISTPKLHTRWKTLLKHVKLNQDTIELSMNRHTDGQTDGQTYTLAHIEMYKATAEHTCRSQCNLQ